jgi:hypothetical protein
MLNPVTFVYEAESGPLTVTASGPDYAAYEDSFDRAVIGAMSEGRYKCWVFLLWHAMNRQGQTTKTFDEFLADSPEFSPPKRAEEIVPLESTAPTGS